MIIEKRFRREFSFVEQTLPRKPPTGKTDWIHETSSFVKGPLLITVAFDSKKGKLVDAQPIEAPYDTERRFEHKVA